MEMLRGARTTGSVKLRCGGSPEIQGLVWAVHDSGL